MFTQNNLAVVTKIRFELIARQESSLRCIVKLKDKDAIGEYTDIVRGLKAENTIMALPHIGNHFRMLGMFSQFDFLNWSTQQGANPADVDRQVRRLKLAPWMAIFSITGSKNVATIEYLRKAYLNHGWIAYRRAIDEMPLIKSELERDSLKLRQIIKGAIDSDNSISPGYYEFLTKG